MFGGLKLKDIFIKVFLLYTKYVYKYTSTYTYIQSCFKWQIFKYCKDKAKRLASKRDILLFCGNIKSVRFRLYSVNYGMRSLCLRNFITLFFHFMVIQGYNKNIKRV